MNPNKVYAECLKSTPTDSTPEQLAKAKAELDNDLAWKQWNALAQTQIFRATLNIEQKRLLTFAMRKFDGIAIELLLNEANTLDKILNSVMINGKYETPPT